MSRIQRQSQIFSRSANPIIEHRTGFCNHLLEHVSGNRWTLHQSLRFAPIDDCRSPLPNHKPSNRKSAFFWSKLTFYRSCRPISANGKDACNLSQASERRWPTVILRRWEGNGKSAVWSKRSSGSVLWAMKSEIGRNFGQNESDDYIIMVAKREKNDLWSK